MFSLNTKPLIQRFLFWLGVSKTV